MRHLLQRIAFMGALLLMLSGLSAGPAGAYDAGEMTQTGVPDLENISIASVGDIRISLTIPGRILAADYDEGGEGVAYHDTTRGNIDSNPSSYRDDDVDIGIRSWDADPLITNTEEGEWLRYTVDVKEAGIYEVEYLLYTTQNNCTLTLDVDGIPTGTITIPAATSWQTPIRVNGKAGFPTAGTHKIVLWLAGDMNLNGMTFSSGGSTSLDADFTASPTSGPAPLRVYFADNSTGTPAAWNWTFGDGDTAKIRDLLHTYTTPGTYTVSLTVSDAAGSDTETKVDYITVENGSFSIEWQRCLGGSYNDEALSVQQTVDGGYVVFGTIWSDDGDVSGHHGGLDIWMVKLDSDGALAWQRCLGGSGGDILPCVRQTSDDGYIVVSATDSTDGDVSGNHGDLDIWVVKLDSSGAIEWQRCLGGSSRDSPSNVLQTSDGGYIVVGDTQSTDGDVAGYHGHIDIWVVKLDIGGAISWQRCFGGSMLELTEEVQQTSDGGYIFAGETESTNGDVIGIHGGFDVWLVKLDSDGAIAWQRCLGGSGSESTMHIQQTPDGGYIFAGGTDSTDGDVIGIHHFYHTGWVLYNDVWVVKLKCA